MPNVECSALRPRLTEVKGHLTEYVREEDGGGVVRDMEGRRFCYSSDFKCDLERKPNVN